MAEHDGQDDTTQIPDGIDVAEAGTAAAGAVGGAFLSSQFGPLATVLGAAVGGISAGSVAADRDSDRRASDDAAPRQPARPSGPT